MADSDDNELIALNQRLLEAIAAGDWKTYQELCDPTLSAFEPEGRGHLIVGMAFHKYYFDLGTGGGARQTTIAAPHVRWLGEDAAVVSFVRLVQKLDNSAAPVTVAFEETRVWQRQQGKWRQVHFHRSLCA